ncbi:ion channel [Desulfosarcina cetonica]
MVYFFLFHWYQYLRDVKNRQQSNIITTYCISYLFIIIYFALVYYIINRTGADFVLLDVNTASPVDYLYHSVMTATTVGYGGIRPNCGYSRFITIFEPLLSAVVLVATLSVILSDTSKDQKEPQEVISEEDAKML